MGRVLKVTIGIVLVALLGAQAVRPDRTNPPVESDVAAPPVVAALLRRACYDCHSHETVWPWYSLVAPASWLLAHDVREGREELDFSNWGAYGPQRKAKKLRETADEVLQSEMPPRLYLLMHREARLNDGERRAVAAWCADEIARLGH